MLIDSEKIAYAKEKLGDKSIDAIVDLMGIPDFDYRNKKCCCPFHEEDTPSFIWNQKEHNFRCFGACSRSYDLIDVLMYKGHTYAEAVKTLFDYAEIPIALGEIGVKTERNYRYPKPIECRDKTAVYTYAGKRKISKETIDYLDIRQDERGNVVFNYYDTNDVLVMVKYRPSRAVEHGESKNWCQKDADTMPVLFNMNRINTSNPLVITSGEFDCAAVVESGWQNAASIPLGDGNTHWIEKCEEWLDQFNDIIICHDNDESGRKYAKEVVPRLGSWKCKIANIPEVYETPDGIRHVVKDVNELLFFGGKDAVIDAIANAKDTPVPSVRDMSDVEDKDFSDLDGVKVGIEPIDKQLYKLFFGTVTILSGLPGSGKSSLIAQLICDAMDDGFNTWLFSGELANHAAKSWSLSILAGHNHLIRYETPDGLDCYYKVDDVARVQINSHYSGRWYIYRDDKDNSLDNLMESMLDTFRKYGARFMILDNFMTIDAGNSSDDELRTQTETVKRLIEFAKRYNVAVLLVCHPRKFLNAGSANMSLFDIAGTSNIANLAHRSISLRRVTNEERESAANLPNHRKALLKYDVVFTILKDRIRGRVGIDIGLYFDPVTRRFYSNRDEFYRVFGWSDEVDDRRIPYPPDEKDKEFFGD